MKKLVLSAVVVMFLMASLSYGFGLGIMLGEPSGLSGKYWMSEKNAIAVSLVIESRLYACACGLPYS